MPPFISFTMSPFRYELLTAATAGLLSHWCFYIHGDHDHHAGVLLRVYGILTFLIFFTQWRIFEMPASVPIYQTALIEAAYVATLTSSMMVYRLFLSPIRDLPGPFMTRMTKLYHFWNITGADNYRWCHKMHQQYGDVVRTGPNEVTLYTTDAFYQVYGSESNCTRAVYYDMMLPFVSLVTTRDLDVHARFRKIWDQGFSIKAIEKLEPKVYEYAYQLVDALKDRVGQTLNAPEWFEYYTFDVMGYVGYSWELGLLKGKKNQALHEFNEGHKVLGPITAVPWLLHLSSSIPYAQESYQKLVMWITGVLREKIEGKQERTDVLDLVISDARENGGIDANWNHLMGDFMLFLSAASEPMRQNLTNILYYIIAEPRHLAQIRAELSSVSDINNYKSIAQLTHLNAVINEALRLNPPVPCAGIRVTPPEGISVCGRHIPGGTNVLVPHYSLFRRADCFVRPEEFIPERFTTRPDMILDKRTWMPWSAGRFSCIGKNLGLMEIRVAAALIVANLDFEFAPGEDGQTMFAQTLDYFTSVPGPLKVVFQKRAGA